MFVGMTMGYTPGGASFRRSDRKKRKKRKKRGSILNKSIKVIESHSFWRYVCSRENGGGRGRFTINQSMSSRVTLSGGLIKKQKREGRFSINQSKSSRATLSGGRSDRGERGWVRVNLRSTSTSLLSLPSGTHEHAKIDLLTPSLFTL